MSRHTQWVVVLLPCLNSLAGCSSSKSVAESGAFQQFVRDDIADWLDGVYTDMEIK